MASTPYMSHPIFFVIAVVWGVSIVSLLLIAGWEWMQHKRKLRSRLGEVVAKAPMPVRQAAMRVAHEVSKDLGTAA